MEDERRPDLSVVIVNWNTQDELEACLRSVEAQNFARLEIIVVDNYSPDGSAQMVRDQFTGVHLIENDRNLGFAKAANQGIAASRGRYVMLLNPDSEVNPGALTALVRFGDENSDIGIIGPRILNPDGSLQFSCRSFPTLMAGVFRNTILTRFFPKNAYLLEYLMVDCDHNVQRDVDWVSGAAVVIRRELLEDVGSLDERFYMYCEDVDLAYRARAKGWRVTYFPGAEVIHAIGKGSSKNANRMIVEHHRSMWRFFRKHYRRKYSPIVWPVVLGGIWARASFYIARNYRNTIRYKLRTRFKGIKHAGEKPCN